MSKFNYTTEVKDGIIAKAGLDLGVVWNHLLIENGDERVLLLYTTLDPVETYKQYQEVNKKGEPTGWSWKKTTESPTIQVTVPEEIDAYLAWWNSQDSV